MIVGRAMMCVSVVVLNLAVSAATAAEETCCREVPWGTVTVALVGDRLVTTGADPQYPTAFALDRVLGENVESAELKARVLVRAPAPTYAAQRVKVALEAGCSGSFELRVRDQVLFTRDGAKPFEPVQFSKEIEIFGETPIQVKATRPHSDQGPWLVRLRLRPLEGDGDHLHCLCRANLRNDPSHYRRTAKDVDDSDPFAKVTAKSLFDGKTLRGWNCSVPKFRVADGAIVTSGKTMERACYYLLTDGEYEDFELTVKVWMEGGNSGIYFRSHREPGSVDAHGYQFDIGDGIWGMLYDERGTRIVGMEQQSMPSGFDPSGWVHCRIRCVGPHIQYWLNGHKTLDYIEEDRRIPRKGNVGLQFHSWHEQPFKVRFKDIQIKEL